MKKRLLISALVLGGFGIVSSSVSADGRVDIVARASLAGGVGAKMNVYVGGKLIFTKEVNNTTNQTITVTSPALVKGAPVDIHFSNDEVVNGQDRNLFIRSLLFNDQMILPKSATYDRANDNSYGSATDGKDVVPGQEAMAWSGALRFTLPGGTSQPGNHAAGVPAKNEFSNNRVSGAIVAKSGMVIENLKISNPNGACITIPVGVTNVRIRNNEIGPCGMGQKKSNGESLDYNGINISGRDVYVERNVIHDVDTAVYAQGAQHPIVVDRNLVYNVRGPMPRGQMVQLNGVSGGFGQSKVTCNVSDKNLRTITTAYEDQINLYKTYGISSNQPIEIAYNKLRGGDSASGTGMVVGDFGGKYINIHHNLVVLPANSGIALAGGSEVYISNNIVWAMGADVNSKTSTSFSAANWTYQVNGHVYFRNNRGAARGWLHGGTGQIDPLGSFYSHGLRAGDPHAKYKINPAFLHLENNNFKDAGLIGMSESQVWASPEFNAPINAACSSKAVTPLR